MQPGWSNLDRKRRLRSGGRGGKLVDWVELGGWIEWWKRSEEQGG